MSFGITDEEYCENLGNTMVCIRLIENGIKFAWWLHRNLLSMLESSLPLPDGDFHKIMDVGGVSWDAMNKFARWLYSDQRTLVGSDLRPLLDVHRLAFRYDIVDLKADCYYALSQHHAVLEELAELLDKNNTRAMSGLVSEALTGLLNSGFEVELEFSSTDSVISSHLLGLKLNSSLFGDMTMDLLQDTMANEDSVFSLEQVNEIFHGTGIIGMSRYASVEVFCVALIHFQRRQHGNCLPHQRLTDEMFQEYLKIPRFNKLYGAYEQKVVHTAGPNDCLDPRISDVFGSCYFHSHKKHEECKRFDSKPSENENEDQQMYEGDEAEGGNDDDNEDEEDEDEEDEDAEDEDLDSRAGSDHNSLEEAGTCESEEIVGTSTTDVDESVATTDNVPVAPEGVFRRSESPSPEVASGQDWHPALPPRQIDDNAAEAESSEQQEMLPLEIEEADAEPSFGSTSVLSTGSKKRKADENVEGEETLIAQGRGQRRKV